MEASCVTIQFTDTNGTADGPAMRMGIDAGEPLADGDHQTGTPAELAGLSARELTAES